MLIEKLVFALEIYNPKIRSLSKVDPIMGISIQIQWGMKARDDPKHSSEVARLVLALIT
jgi:hypothetical protein